ncbi:lipid IV(A) 3-deoxy-D-manno-octulosonic acid transferase [Vibrio sp. Hep-1b-8]|uniref:lipid IV(A) 3-deoxy-D-manno-octulosonic acid transferase n=1 Tax=Vibrio sp. Hep-1b-8 TaxID=2144187 RepID=UPI0011106809|nr:lipid IV(A) 3-deoxy-D-manno-octulosonic acid transferase [Vibrio sp. Hep-1b-8]TMX34650.1 3-deoxy-D-manno-octulosonic acid transferase [Vibrio sp. Hep-1b-8]
MQTCIRIIYSMVLLIAAPFLLFGLLKTKQGKPSIGKRWNELFGKTPLINNSAKDVVWIHAVSVGETIAVTPFIKALKKRSPETQVILTTTTTTGAKQAESLSELVTHRYMPIDFPFAVKGFLEAVQPNKLIIVETELWPNTIHTVAKFGVPIYVLNARLSEKSFKGYKRVQPLFDTIAPCLSQILCLHQDDAVRFKKLGVNEAKISVTGSIKFDISVSSEVTDKAANLKHSLGKNRPIWIAASTHQGEDELILHAHKKVLEKEPSALLILVPRHPERFNRVFSLCDDQSLVCSRRSTNDLVGENTQVYLGDTMGELMVMLGASDVCFIGGSLVGNKVGGHNLLEPAALGKPTIIGPSYFNFTDITNQLTKAGANIICSETELSDHVVKLLSSPAKRHKMGEKALTVVDANRGALNKSLDLILD